jgi:hypothetical protein
MCKAPHGDPQRPAPDLEPHPTLDDSALPLIYHQAFNATDPSNGTASIANVHRVLASSGVGASTIEQVSNSF